MKGAPASKKITLDEMDDDELNDANALVIKNERLA